MVGNNDRIHGYNERYRVHDPVNLHSFDWQNRRPTQFRNQKVLGVPSLLDHQGHIIPQNMLNSVMDPVASEMVATVNDPDDIEPFIQANEQQYPWLRTVYNYGTTINAPMFDFDERGQEEKVGGFFAIVTWNPINICRAPSDSHRGGAPGQTVDTAVLDFIENDPDQATYNRDWMAAARAVQANRNNTAKYIQVCSQTLEAQLQNGQGFYQFHWHSSNGLLVPGAGSAQETSV